jgi:hypothetical protein
LSTYTTRNVAPEKPALSTTLPTTTCETSPSTGGQTEGSWSENAPMELDTLISMISLINEEQGTLPPEFMDATVVADHLVECPKCNHVFSATSL